MEESVDVPKQVKKGIPRRGFLRLLFGAGAAAVATKVVPKAFVEVGEAANKAAEVASEASLQNAMVAGKFNFKDKNVTTGWDLNQTIRTETEKLSGVKASGMWVSDIENNFQISTGEYTDKFIPGSILKLPLLYHVWSRGQAEGNQPLTPEIAQRILGKSEESRSFIMSLPQNQGKSESETNSVLMQMMRELGFNNVQEISGDIEIGLEEYFGFLRRTDFPPVMMDAMLQTQEDDPENYGVSKVMRDNSSGHDPLYFKIGIGETPEGHQFNSYVFMIGNDIRAVGYAKGDSPKDIHEQMLISAAALSKYSAST